MGIATIARGARAAHTTDVLLITGPPAAGKNTVGGLVAEGL